MNKDYYVKAQSEGVRHIKEIVNKRMKGFNVRQKEKGNTVEQKISDYGLLNERRYVPIEG